MSESTAEPAGETPAVVTEQPPVETTATVEELAAEVEKWQALSRKNEERAKANAKAQKELDALKLASMTEQEQAVEAARIEARTETLREVGETRVGDAFRVAAAGKQVDVEEILDGINLAKFLGDDGQPNAEAITQWVEKIAPPVAEEAPAGFPDLGQGARAGGTTPLNSDGLEAALKNAVGIR